MGFLFTNRFSNPITSFQLVLKGFQRQKHVISVDHVLAENWETVICLTDPFAGCGVNWLMNGMYEFEWCRLEWIIVVWISKFCFVMTCHGMYLSTGIEIWVEREIISGIAFSTKLVLAIPLPLICLDSYLLFVRSLLWTVTVGKKTAARFHTSRPHSKFRTGKCELSNGARRGCPTGYRSRSLTYYTILQ